MTAAISHTVDADLRAASIMMCRLCCLRMLLSHWFEPVVDLCPCLRRYAYRHVTLHDPTIDDRSPHLSATFPGDLL